MIKKYGDTLRKLQIRGVMIQPKRFVNNNQNKLHLQLHNQMAFEYNLSILFFHKHFNFVN